MSDVLTTWAGSHTFRGGPLVHPTSVDEVAEVVAGARHVRAIGSRHSFHDLADSPGTLVALDRLDVPLEIRSDEAAGATVTVGGGVRYGELARALHAAGWALHTMASLPHIAVAGTVATATHGSGDSAVNLAAVVRGLELVGAGGEVRQLGPGDELAGSVVALGALGVVTRVTLAVEPTFDVAQESGSTCRGPPRSTGSTSSWDRRTRSACSPTGGATRSGRCGASTAPSTRPGPSRRRATSSRAHGARPGRSTPCRASTPPRARSREVSSDPGTSACRTSGSSSRRPPAPSCSPSTWCRARG
jgi:hypothetical protein